MTIFFRKLFAALLISSAVHEVVISSIQMKEFYNFPRIRFKEEENGKYIVRQKGKHRHPCYFCNSTISHTIITQQGIDQQCLAQNKENLDYYEVSENMLPFCNTGVLPSCNRRDLPKFYNGYWVCSDYEVVLIDQFGYKYCGSFLSDIPVYSKCKTVCSLGFHLLEVIEVRCDETRLFSLSPGMPFCIKFDISRFRKIIKGKWFETIGNVFRKQDSDALTWKLNMIALYLDNFEVLYKKVETKEEEDAQLKDKFQTIKMELGYAKNSRISASKNLDKVVNEKHASKPLLTMLRALESTLYTIISIESTVWSMDIDIESIEEMAIILEDIKHIVTSVEESIEAEVMAKFPERERKLIIEDKQSFRNTYLMDIIQSIWVVFSIICCIYGLKIYTGKIWSALNGPLAWYYLGRYSEDSFAFEMIFTPSNEDVTKLNTFYEKGNEETKVEWKHLVFIGGKGDILTTSKIKKELKRMENTAVCVMLNLEEGQGDFKITSSSRLALWLPLNSKEYWSVVPPSGHHRSWIEYKTYMNLKDLNYIRGELGNFENYTTKLQVCKKVLGLLQSYHKQIAIFPGTYQRTKTPTIAVCTFDEVKSYPINVSQTLHKYNVDRNSITDRTIEQRRINDYLNDKPQRRPSKRVRIVIQEVEEKLMMEHSNLNAISSSRVKSRNDGLKIKDEECIVLYCTCKGIIPLLETEFPAEINGYTVDVREGYEIAAMERCTDYCDPILIGCSVGAAGRNSTGSVGPFVNEIQSGMSGFLSCAHVFHDIPLSTSGYLPAQQQRTVSVVQPSDSDKGQSRRRRQCGTLVSAFVGNVDVQGQQIGTDIAYVRQSSRIPDSPAFPDVSQQQKEDNGYMKNPTIGNPIMNLDEDDQEHLVYKCGRTTGFTIGKINTIYGSVKRLTDRGSLPGGSCFILLKQMYEIRNVGRDASFFSLGDSGSGVFLKFKRELRLIGIATSLSNARGDLCYVTPISAAVEALRKDSVNVTVNKFDVQPMDQT